MSVNKTAKMLMVQGTSSDAGKSAVVTGLCRFYRRQGYSVAPFKPQNMALNSAVTEDGGEIGRAQAVQARACGLAPHTDMNPVLLKPNSDTGAQVIVRGRARADMDARAYHAYKAELLAEVIDSFTRLAARHDLVIVEGAGSPAEINLREHDIANMGFASAVQCPVLLLADIERGGVFANLYGTLALLDKTEQNLIKAMLINRFRGDKGILQPGLDWLQRQTQKPLLGVLPYIKDLYLEAEDSLNHVSNSPQGHGFRVVVPRLPRLSNHTDFDPLRLHAGIDFRYVGQSEHIPAADLVILPGSKSVRGDLDWLQQQGWVEYLNRHLRYGGKLLGICGGYQMLGDSIHDPHGIEGPAGSSQGLQLLSMQTRLQKHKQLQRVSGELFYQQAPVTGYEIHAGQSWGDALESPAIKIGQGFDGALSADKQIMGTYLHGLFDQPMAAQALLEWAGFTQLPCTDMLDMAEEQEKGIDLMADILEEHLDLALLSQIIGL